MYDCDYDDFLVIVLGSFWVGGAVFMGSNRGLGAFRMNCTAPSENQVWSGGACLVI